MMQNKQKSENQIFSQIFEMGLAKLQRTFMQF